VLDCDWLASTVKNEWKKLQTAFSIIGHLSSEIGLGHAARNIAHSAIDSEIPTRLVDMPLKGRSGIDEFSLVCERYTPGHLNFLVCGIHQAGKIYDVIDAAGLGKYNIIYPFWELEKIPKSVVSALNRYDEVIAPSDFLARALGRQLTRSIKTISLPVKIPGTVSGNSRVDGVMRVFTALDFDSYVQRKNPLASVAAFQLAFPDRSEKVELVIKVRGKNDGGVRRALYSACVDDPRISLVDRMLSQPEMDSLKSKINVYLSLHRAEGFGLGPAEALAAGKIVVATDYGGSQDFINHQTGFPIDFEMVRLKKGDYLYWNDQFWAEPSLKSAAQALRHVSENYANALSRADTGRAWMLRNNAFSVAGESLSRILPSL